MVYPAAAIIITMQACNIYNSRKCNGILSERYFLKDVCRSSAFLSFDFFVLSHKDLLDLCVVKHTEFNIIRDEKTYFYKYLIKTGDYLIKNSLLFMVFTV